MTARKKPGRPLAAPVLSLSISLSSCAEQCRGEHRSSAKKRKEMETKKPGNTVNV